MKHTAIRSFCALALVLALAASCAPALADNPYYMYVSTGNSGRLHLRSLPTTASQSLGLYANGTQVRVNSISGSWAFVTVLYNGASGYMALGCLAGNAPVYPVNPQPAPPQTEDTLMYVRTGNSGRLHLRISPSQNAQSLGLFPNGTQVRVLARTGGWAYVNINGLAGYMMLNYLSGGAGPVPPVVRPTPVPGNYVGMYVRTGNTGKLHLRDYPSQASASLGLYPNGTQVYAKDMGNGWSEVLVNGRSGYMMSRFLAYYGAAPTLAPTPAPAPTGAPVGKSMYVNTGNSGKLYLRSSMDTNSAALGLYPNGTPVTVLYDFGPWVYVDVYGARGYMMARYLSSAAYSTGSAGATSAPTAVSASQPGSATVWNVNSSFVYLRSSKDSNGTTNVLAQVPNGAVVQLLHRETYWSLIRYNGIEGYMVTNYLK